MSECPECHGEGFCQGVPGLMEAPEDATYVCALCQGAGQVPEHIANYVSGLKAEKLDLEIQLAQMAELARRQMQHIRRHEQAPAYAVGG